jgi:IS605 OrfB family transposase
VRLPKLGWVRCRFADEIVGKANSVTVRWNGQRWILSVQASQEINDGVHPNKTIVAGDFGVARRVTFSDGVVVPPIDVSWEEQRIAWYLHVRIANIRKDETHKFTTRYSKSHAIIVLEDLNIKRMSASAAGTMEQPGSKVAEKSGLNRAILRQGWGEIGRQLEYKESWGGGMVHYQSEAYTSQQCPSCRGVSRDNRKRQERFACVRCGFGANADEVAAHNQLQKFLSSDEGEALLASGYRASVDSLWSGRSWDSAMKQEPKGRHNVHKLSRNPRLSSQGACQRSQAMGFAAFAGHKYLSLETFKKNGDGVKTPVWFAADPTEDLDSGGAKLFVYTIGVSGKVKRIRNNGRVKIAPCDMRGAVLDDWVDARAEIVSGAAAEFGMRLLNKKYLPWKQLLDFAAMFRRRERSVFVIRPA